MFALNKCTRKSSSYCLLLDGYKTTELTKVNVIINYKQNDHLSVNIKISTCIFNLNIYGRNTGVRQHLEEVLMMRLQLSESFYNKTKQLIKQSEQPDMIIKQCSRLSLTECGFLACSEK
ncbi:Hypothetical_protein [Hexamita inflata]|uniref:Hypothetical_protein n=1 Tax=Hexamita inflata TaxID=28002 RepID=A0ABP1GHG8_9EUKA